MSTARLFPAALRVVYVLDVVEAGEVERLEALLAGGVTCLWLRAPQATARSLYQAAASLLLRCRRHDRALLVGDRVDVALAVGADGVQLGHRAVPIHAVRPWYPGWIGVSCHDAQEIAAAVDGGANHVVVSPVFGVPGKGEALGVEGFRLLARGVGVPVLALGGVTEAQGAALVAAGAHGLAAIRALRDAPDPRAAAARLRAAVTSR